MEKIKSNTDDISILLLEQIKDFKYETSTAELTELDFFKNIDNNRIGLTLNDKYILIYRKDITDSEHIYANVLIGRIELDDKANPIGFKAVKENSLISDTFDTLSVNKFFKKIRNDFDIPNLGEEAKQEALKLKIAENKKAEEQSRKEDEAKELKIKSQLSYRPKFNIKTTDIKIIEQGKAGYIDGTKGNQYIETNGLATCIGVVLWNSKTKNAGIVHIDANTNLSLLDSLLKNVGNDNNLKIDIIGGRSLDVLTNSEYPELKNFIIDEVLKIKHFLEKKGLYEQIRSWDVLDIEMGGKNIKNIIIDKKNGIIYDK